MKILVNRNRDTRKVIDTGLDDPLIIYDRYSQRRSYSTYSRASGLTSSERDRNGYFQKNLTESRGIARKKTSQRKSYVQDREPRNIKMILKDDMMTIASEKFAGLSVNVPVREQINLQAGSIKNSAEPCAIQLREPVLQFSRSYETEASSSNAGDDYSSRPADKSSESQQLIESIVEAYKCTACPNYSVPNVYECPSGHSVCEECWLVQSHCSQCTNESPFRRVLAMERIACLLKFPCRWRQRGCPEALDAATWREHVDSCPHAEVQLNLLTTAASSSPSSSRLLDDYLSDYEIDVDDDVVDLYE